MPTGLICLRSLGETIITAGSTLAVFGASNWGLACIVGDTQNPGFWMRLFYHSVIAFAMPVVPLYISIWNFFKVRAVQKRLHQESGVIRPETYHPRSIPIVTLCPLYIQIPATSYNSDEVGARYKRITDSQIKNLCPLKLAPAASSAAADAASQGLINAGMNAFSDVEPNNAWMYLQLPETCNLNTTSGDVDDRFALLASGLVPEHQDIRYLRKRGPFQTTVTVVQASRYVVSVVEREWQQHLGVSPMEAVISFLSILVILQLVIELYACGNYERPLLLCLNHDQFTSFQNARPTGGRSLGSYITRKHRIIISGCTFVIQLALVTVAALWYYRTYQHHYHLSSISSLVFVASVDMLFTYCTLHLFKANPRNSKLPYLMIINAIFVASMILTLVSTIIDWTAFHQAKNSKFAWIFPHLSR